MRPLPKHHELQDLWDRIWKDSSGRVVIWQMPNWWLIGWATATTVSLFFEGHLADILAGGASVALIVWSGLEITKGVNYFRRGLGLVVLIFSLMTLIKTI